VKAVKDTLKLLGGKGGPLITILAAAVTPGQLGNSDNPQGNAGATGDPCSSIVDCSEGGNQGKVYENQLPERLKSEMRIASESGVSPVRAGTSQFDALLARNETIKWAVNVEGELWAVPHTVNGQEISHAVITRGNPVRAAGQADISVSRGVQYGIEITPRSGHFMNGNNNAANVAARRLGMDAFSRQQGIKF